jgi:hypothetical protein
MRKLFRISALATLALGTLAATARAQDKSTELTAGVIGYRYTTCSGCDGISQFNTGGAYFALGFYMSPGLALEPTIGSTYTSQSGYHVTTLSLGVAVPYYFNKDWGRKGMYLAPRAFWNDVSAGGGGASSSSSQFELGLALGTKAPLNDMAALRLQVAFDHGFSNADNPSTSAFGVSAGLSVFLK